jgi:prepilin peptidase CpaA
MDALTPQELPFILLLCALLLLSAGIDLWKLKVPNWLTFSMILSGWLYGLLISLGYLETRWTGSEMGGHVGASFALTGVGLALLLPAYALGWMGAGDVKMQMGYGSWIGAHYGWEVGWPYVVYGFCVAVIVGGIIALGMIWWRGDFRQNRANLAAMMQDLMNPTKAAEAAAKRKPRMQLLPYGVPLCIGYITYIIMPFRIL